MRRLLFVLSLLVASISQASSVVPPSVYFVENQGQWQGEFRYRAALGHGVAFVTERGLVLDLQSRDKGKGIARKHLREPWKDGGQDRLPEPVSVRGHVLRLTFLDANTCPTLLGEDKLASYSNYFLGRDSSRWKSRVGHYQRVLSQEVWPGIDVEYVLKPGGVELVYYLLAGVDAQQIQLQIEGLTAPLTLDASGNLVLPTSLGPLTEQASTAFQQGRAIPCRYRLTSDSSYCFSLDGYDPQQELIIDPLLYSTFFGGKGWEEFDEFLIDPRDQSLVVSGTTNSSTLPTTPGAYQDSLCGSYDIFITRFTANGQSLIFSTYLGGSDEETPRCMTITPTCEIYLGGSTHSGDWPLSADAVDTVYAGEFESYFCRLSADGTVLVFSSYFGGVGDQDYVINLQLDSTGLVYIYGHTNSPDFVITPDALFPQFQGIQAAYVSVFNPATAQILLFLILPRDVGGLC